MDFCNKGSIQYKERFNLIIVRKPMSDINPYKNVQKQIDNSKKLVDFDPEIIEILKFPQKIIEVSIPMHMDNGKIKIFHGYRVQHNNYRGHTKGESATIRRSISMKLRRWQLG